MPHKVKTKKDTRKFHERHVGRPKLTRHHKKNSIQSIRCLPKKSKLRLHVSNLGKYCTGRREEI